MAGDRDWPRRLVRLTTQRGRHAFVWRRGAEPVALLDIERHEDASAAVAIVVSPEDRGQGIGTAVLGSIFSLHELAGTDRVIGEVEQGNVGGERLVRAAAFTPDQQNAGAEGFSRWVLRAR